MFFSYSSFESDVHDTEVKAIAAANEYIDYYRDNAADGWSDEVKNVFWGEIKACAKECDVEPAPSDSNVDYVCDYELVPNDNKNIKISDLLPDIQESLKIIHEIATRGSDSDLVGRFKRISELSKSCINLMDSPTGILALGELELGSYDGPDHIENADSCTWSLSLPYVRIEGNKKPTIQEYINNLNKHGESAC